MKRSSLWYLLGSVFNRRLSLSLVFWATIEDRTRQADNPCPDDLPFAPLVVSSPVDNKNKKTVDRWKDNQDIAFNIPVDLYDECFYVTGILSFWILLPSCVLIVLSILTAVGFFFLCSGRENRENDEDTRWKKGRGRLTVYSRIKVSC